MPKRPLTAHCIYILLPSLSPAFPLSLPAPLCHLASSPRTQSPDTTLPLPAPHRYFSPSLPFACILFPPSFIFWILLIRLPSLTSNELPFPFPSLLAAPFPYHLPSPFSRTTSISFSLFTVVSSCLLFLSPNTCVFPSLFPCCRFPSSSSLHR